MAPDRLDLQRELGDSPDTVTRFLEALVGEEIVADVVRQTQVDVDSDDGLGVTAGEGLVHRMAVLKGRHTHRPYLWAESTYVPQRLPEPVRAQLAGTSGPIGEILTRHGLRLERASSSPPDHDSPPPADLATSSSEIVWSRAYRLKVEGVAAFAIREWFLRSVLDALGRADRGAAPRGPGA